MCVWLFVVVVVVVLVDQKRFKHLRFLLTLYVCIPLYQRNVLFILFFREIRAKREGGKEGRKEGGTELRREERGGIKKIKSYFVPAWPKAIPKLVHKFGDSRHSTQKSVKRLGLM